MAMSAHGDARPPRPTRVATHAPSSGAAHHRPPPVVQLEAQDQSASPSSRPALQRWGCQHLSACPLALARSTPAPPARAAPAHGARCGWFENAEAASTTSQRRRDALAQTKARSRAAASTTSPAAARQPLGELAQHRRLQRSRNFSAGRARARRRENTMAATAPARGLATVQATRRRQMGGRSVPCRRRQAAGRGDGRRTPIKKLPPRWAPGREL